MDQAAAKLDAETLDGRARILRASRDLFTEHGFRAVSMQQIADEAGVNKATLYHHFTDKEALFVEVLRQEFNRIHTHLNTLVPEQGTLRTQLLHVATKMLGAPSPDIGRLMADLRESVSAERRAELMSKASPPWDSLVPVFERAKERGEIALIDTALLSRLFFVMIASQLGWSKFGGCAQPDEQTAEIIVSILLDGIAVGTANDPEAAAGPSLASHI